MLAMISWPNDSKWILRIDFLMLPDCPIDETTAAAGDSRYNANAIGEVVKLIIRQLSKGSLSKTRDAGYRHELVTSSAQYCAIVKQ